MDLNKTPITYRGHNRYLLELRQLARKNRKNPTEAECLVWNTILRKKFVEYKFTRQKPINRFIIDFYCAKLLLAIEIDGDSHDLKLDYDSNRDLILKKIGIKTLRYSNEIVLNQLEGLYYDLKKQMLLREKELGLK